MASITGLIKATGIYIWAFIKLIFTLIYRFVVILAFIGLILLGLVKLIYLVVRDLIRGGYYISKTTTGIVKDKLIVPVTDAYIVGSEIAEEKTSNFKKVSFKSKGEALRHAWNDLKGGKLNNTWNDLKRRLGFKLMETTEESQL